jgi:hypothetical protein
MADDHKIDINTVVDELCDWAFNDFDSKEQFKVWLDETYPKKGEAEEEAEATGEEAAEEEEEYEEESEEESHEHRD